MMSSMAACGASMNTLRRSGSCTQRLPSGSDCSGRPRRTAALPGALALPRSQWNHVPRLCDRQGRRPSRSVANPREHAASTRLDRRLARCSGSPAAAAPPVGEGVASDGLLGHRRRQRRRRSLAGSGVARAPPNAGQTAPQTRRGALRWAPAFSAKAEPSKHFCHARSQRCRLPSCGRGGVPARSCPTAGPGQKLPFARATCMPAPLLK